MSIHNVDAAASGNEGTPKSWYAGTDLHWYVDCLKNYTGFTGRAGRREFWWYVLINAVIGIVLSVIFRPLEYLYALAVFLPGLAVAVRRLHDTGRSAWWLLWDLFPVVGWIVLIIVATTDGNPGQNNFGPDPKAVAAT
jgi:uncharacterized membrane protein YhaH (DUF805 family)